MTLDSSGNIRLDSDTGDIRFEDGGTAKIWFNTTEGHITASGNISSSGNIIGADIFLPSGGKISFDDSLNGSDQFISGIDNSITIDGDNIVKLRADQTIEFQDTSNNAQVTVNPIAGHITASGNIIATGTVTADSFAGDGSNLTGISADGLANNSVDTAEIAANAVETAKINDLAVTTAKIADNAVTGDKIEDNPTIAGNLAVDGNTTLGNATGDTTTISGNITASGNISADGTITANEIHAASLINHLGDANTGLQFSSDTVTIQGNNEEIAVFASSIIRFTEHLNSTHYISGSSLISDSHITASGNISSSGKFIGNELNFAGPGTGNDYIRLVNNSVIIKSDDNSISLTGNVTASGNISAGGEIKAASLDINGVADISGVTTFGANANFANLVNFTKTNVDAETSENFFRIKFKDVGGVHNDVGIGQSASDNLGFNTTAGGTFTFNDGTNGNVLTISNGQATFDGEVEAASLDINGVANISDHLVVKGTTSQPLSSLFHGSLVVQGGNDEDPLIAVTDVNEANAAAGVFHQSSTSPGFPALVINAASNGSEQPLISARTNVNNSTGVGGTEVFAVDGDGDATFAGNITASGNISSSGTVYAETVFLPHAGEIYFADTNTFIRGGTEDINIDGDNSVQLIGDNSVVFSTPHTLATGFIQATSYITSSEVRVAGHITASGNISASGILHLTVH